MYILCSQIKTPPSVNSGSHFKMSQLIVNKMRIVPKQPLWNNSLHAYHNLSSTSGNNNKCLAHFFVEGDEKPNLTTSDDHYSSCIYCDTPFNSEIESQSLASRVCLAEGKDNHILYDHISHKHYWVVQNGNPEKFSNDKDNYKYNFVCQSYRQHPTKDKRVPCGLRLTLRKRYCFLSPLGKNATAAHNEEPRRTHRDVDAYLYYFMCETPEKIVIGDTRTLIMHNIEVSVSESKYMAICIDEKTGEFCKELVQPCEIWDCYKPGSSFTVRFTTKQGQWVQVHENKAGDFASYQGHEFFNEMIKTTYGGASFVKEFVW